MLSKIDAAVGDRVHALIRPEDVAFTTSRDIGSARECIEGEITRVTLGEPLLRIEVFCGVPLLGVLTTVSARELEPTVGKHVFASFKATATYVIRRRG